MFKKLYIIFWVYNFWYISFSWIQNLITKNRSSGGHLGTHWYFYKNRATLNWKTGRCMSWVAYSYIYGVYTYIVRHRSSPSLAVRICFNHSLFFLILISLILFLMDWDYRVLFMLDWDHMVLLDFVYVGLGWQDFISIKKNSYCFKHVMLWFWYVALPPTCLIYCLTLNWSFFNSLCETHMLLIWCNL